METRLDQGDSVRCVSCHSLYQPAGPGTPEADAAGCPNCGETRWLAERVPVEESGSGETA